MSLADGIKLLRDNIDRLAEQADGNFIDPKHRPKSERETWTAASYKKDVLSHLKEIEREHEDWQEDWKHTHFSGLFGFVLQAIDRQHERFRDVYKLVVRPLPTVSPSELAARKRRLQGLRGEQATMDRFDPDRKCLQCYKFLFMYDRTNNKRHEREEVCTCKSSRVIQGKMKEKTSAYRKEMKRKRKIKENKEKRR